MSVFCSTCNKTTNGRFCSDCGSLTKPLPAKTASSVNVFGEEDDREAREDARVMAHVQKSIGRAKVSSPSRLVERPTGWEITLGNLPQDRGMPVELHIRGSLAYKSDGSSDTDVSANITSLLDPTEKYGGTYAFNLKIPVMGADINKKFDTDGGLYLKFEFKPQGLAIVQSPTPI
eukprot:TRINITY_DN9059_c0_g3_i1.p1 TRINITY_DN9059_c0_g3~~TRINITY_DN9059_c0_g3_i1.p1  ORF type:complete len:175 (-),score=26.23 TRINITY_DN9059_c0_g3_i1:156-680(-)